MKRHSTKKLDSGTIEAFSRSIGESQSLDPATSRAISSETKLAAAMARVKRSVANDGTIEYLTDDDRITIEPGDEFVTVTRSERRLSGARHFHAVESIAIPLAIWNEMGVKR